MRARTNWMYVFLINITLHVAIFNAIIIKYFQVSLFAEWNEEQTREANIRDLSGNLVWNFFFHDGIFIFWYSAMYVCVCVYLPYIYYLIHAKTHIQWARINERMKPKWQPMSSIFCCLDRIYITLTRVRHKLDHTNQLTGYIIESFLLFFFNVFRSCIVLRRAIVLFGHFNTMPV